MKSPQFKSFSIKQIHKFLAQRVFAVPKLQREFVWDGRKAATLFDSIYKNMPIGMLLIWETKRKHYDLLRQNLNILPAFNTENPFGWFLVDGQQRLSVIHSAFEGSSRSNSSGTEIDFSKICFDVDLNDGDHSTFTYRKPVERQFISLREILNTNWRNYLSGYPQHLLKRIGKCRNHILQYKIPVIVAHSEHLEEVREIFLRINSQGMKISSADRAFAQARRVDLRNLAHQLRENINENFRELDFNVILQGFAFVTPERETDLGQRALEATIQWWERQIESDGQNSHFYARWHSYRKAVGKAIDYLASNFNVVDSTFLPSTNMIATLAVFFCHHPAAPNSRQRHEIRKWFWATGVCQRYSGRGYRTNVLQDVKWFEKLASKKRCIFIFHDQIDPLEIIRAEYTQRSAITNAFYCLLASNKPTYITNGQPVPATQYASRANRSDRHHIFPRAMLAAKGFKHSQYNSICNICFIVAEENQQFGMRRPDSYLEQYKLKKHFSRAMRSHLIPYNNESGFFIKGVPKAFKQFCKVRMEVIRKAFEKEAGIKLFRKA